MAGMESPVQCAHYARTGAAPLKLWSPDQHQQGMCYKCTFSVHSRPGDGGERGETYILTMGAWDSNAGRNLRPRRTQRMSANNPALPASPFSQQIFGEASHRPSAPLDAGVAGAQPSPSLQPCPEMESEQREVSTEAKRATLTSSVVATARFLAPWL